MAPTSSDPKAEFLTTAALRKLPAKVLKKLLLKHHPDKGGEKEAFQRVFEQYSLKKQAEELEAKTPVAGVVPRKDSDVPSTTASSGNAPASKNQHTSRHRDADAYFKRPPSAKRFDPGDREQYSDTRVYNDGVFYEKYFGAGGGKKEAGVDDEDLMKRFANLRTRSGVGVEKKAGAAGSTPSSSSTTSSRKNSNSNNGSSATNGTSRWDWQPPGAAPAGGVGGEKRRASGTGVEAGASSSANKGGKPTTTQDARNRPSGASGGNSSPGKSTPSAGGGPSSRSTRAGAGAGKTTPAKTKAAAEKQRTSANKAEEQPVDWAQVKKRWLKQELLLEHLRHQLKHSKTRDAEDERILNSLLKSEQSLVHEFSTECSGSSKSGSKSSSRDGGAAGEQEDDEAENEGLQMDQEHQEDEEDVEDSFFGAGGAGLGSTSDELSKVDELLQEHEEAMLDMLFEEYTTSS